MAVNEDYRKFVEDQLSLFGPFESKKMFGGIGFFRDGIMFGMIGKGTLRFKVDDSNRADYESAGMLPLTSENKKKSMPYYEVPQSVVEDREALKIWADKAFAIAVAAKKK